jgi:hypothetical protein
MGKFSGRSGMKIMSNAQDFNVMDTTASNGYIVTLEGGGGFRIEGSPGEGFVLIRDNERFDVGGASSAEEAIEAYQAQTGEKIESVTPDYSVGDYGRGAIRGATLGGAMGLPLGGPVGGAVGAPAGAAGEMTAMGLEEGGYGGGAQFGGSAAVDLGISAIQRRPTASLMRRIPGVQDAIESGVEYLGKGGKIKQFLSRNWAAESTGYAERQAGKLITDLPTPSPTSHNPAVEVVESIRSGHQMMDDVYQSARRQAEKETLGSYGSTESLTRKSGELLEDFKHLDEIPSVLRNSAELPGEITLREAENIRKGVGSAYAKSQLPLDRGGIPHYKRMGEMYEPLDDVLEDITAHSEMGERSVGAMREMREARKVMHQKSPESGAMYRYMIGSERMDNAQKALDRILSSDKAVAEVKMIRGMMGGIGDDIALRRSAIIHVLQRRLGVQADAVASSAPSAGAAIGKASAEEAGLVEILGIRGYGNLTDILDDVSSAGGKSKTLMGKLRGSGNSRLLMILAGSAGMGGAYSDSAGGKVAAAVLGLGSVFEAFMKQNGREATANLALSALVDPDVYRLAVLGGMVNNAEAAAVRLGQTLVRRGLFAADELGGDG